LFFDFFQAVKFTFIYAAAPLGYPVPRRLVSQIQIPERPGPALHGPYRIYQALALVLFILQKGAVAISLFGQADPPSHLPGMLSPQFRLAYL